MKVILVANSKGGCGKSMLSSHLAWAAAQQDLRVLAVDTDTQSALFRRLMGDAPSSAGQQESYDCHGTVVYSPDNVELDEDKYDVVIIDSKGKDQINELLRDVELDLVVMPVNGTDALREASVTTGEIRKVSKTVNIVLVLNQLSIGGSSADEMRQLKKQKLPKRVSVLEYEIGTSRSIWTSEEICEPAWRQVYTDKQSTILQVACWRLLEQVGVLEMVDE